MRAAALYVRASTDLQIYSTINQEDVLRTFAADHNMAVTHVYRDDGLSGLTLEHRPGLRQLLQDVLLAGRAFDRILVYDISRWGRFQEADEGAFYEQLCRRAGVDIVYVAEPFQNEAGPYAGIFKAIKRVMAAEYSRELSRKVLSGQLRMASRGYSQGGVAGIGLRRMLVDAQGRRRFVLKKGDTKGLHTDRVIFVPGPPDEVALVNRIFRMFAEEGVPPHRIAKILNEEGVPSPRGCAWRQQTVYKILKNERYVGTYTFNREGRPLKSKSHPNAPQDWVRVIDAFEPIVPLDLFNAASRRRRPYPSPKTNDEILAGLKRLHGRHGRLSARLINQDPDLPHFITVKRRLGSFWQLKTSLGINEPQCASFDEWRAAHSYSDEEILVSLRKLKESCGRLSNSIINNDKNTASVRTIGKHFGSLRVALARMQAMQDDVPAPSVANEPSG